MLARYGPVWVLVTTLLVVVSTAGCVMQISFINEQQARAIVVRSSNTGHLRATEPANVLQAELMTLEAAEKRMAQNGDSNRAQPPTVTVWLVTLEGTWTLVGGPPTPAGASPVPQTIFHHYAIILDASTDQLIRERAND